MSIRGININKDNIILAWKSIKITVSYITNCISIIFTFLIGKCSSSKMKACWSEHIQRLHINYLRVKHKGYGSATYNGQKILNYDQSNKIIADAIESGEPFMAGRYGSVEISAFWKVNDNGRGYDVPVWWNLAQLCHNAGFFPRDKELLIKFAELMKWSTSKVDLMGIWRQPMEEYELRTYGNNPKYCSLSALQPFWSKYPWSAKLEGKKVLVIHPFYKTIPEQYKKRELLFPGKNILPEFELIMQRAVQTIAGNRDERFNNWFEALDYMYNEAMSKDFDVAIIGCGAYGFPLAAKIKSAGKIAIHLAGATQLLFGIMGKRWEGSDTTNENWVHPADEEKPSGFKTIENGCYW